MKNKLCTIDYQLEINERKSFKRQAYARFRHYQTAEHYRAGRNNAAADSAAAGIDFYIRDEQRNGKILGGSDRAGSDFCDGAFTRNEFLGDGF